MIAFNVLLSLLSLAVLGYLVLQNRDIMDRLQQIEDIVATPPAPFVASTEWGGHDHFNGGTVVWIFRQGGWSVREDHSAPGFMPGSPPAFPGRHEGQCVRQGAVRASDGQ